MKKLRSTSIQTIIRLLLQALAVLTFLVAIGWFIFEPGFEPVLAILASVAVFLSPLFLKLEEKESSELQTHVDECESKADIQLEALHVGKAEMGGGGVANFLHDYQVYFGGRQKEIEELDAWVAQTDRPFGLLVAPAGMGKSALVANWSERLKDSGEAIVVYHPISLRYGTNSQKQTLRSLLMQLSDAARKESASEPKHTISALALINESFNKEELQELCHHLFIDYDNLGNGGKRDRARQLIELCQRNNRLDELKKLCQERRPHHDWDTAFSHTGGYDQLFYEPPQEGDDERLLSGRLRENLRKPSAWNKPLVVIIDGLDELDNQLNQSDVNPVDFLPNKVGAGVYVLAVARGESSDVRDTWRRALGWERSPVCLFTLGALHKKDIREMVDRSGLGIEDNLLATIADKLYELSEDGDPLIASLWLDWLTKQSGQEPSILWDGLEEQSPGINTYIEGILAQINPLINGGAKQLFEVLSLARGPLTITDLYALGIKIDLEQLERLVNLSGRLIIGNEYAYVFSHTRIRQAVQDKYAPQESISRQQWLDRFHRYGRCSFKQASQTPPEKIPDYILNYYADHLHLDKPSGFEKSLYALIDKVWMEAHYGHSGNYDGFLRDVDRALSVSCETGTKQVVNGEATDQLSLQIRGLMCHSSITSLSNNLPPHLPALLVGDRIWKPQQAVSHVQRITDLTQRTQALVALLKVEESEQILRLAENQGLHDVISSSALRNMQLLWQQNDVDEAELYRLQLAISPVLSPAYVDEALLLAGKVQRSIWQARLLAELLPIIEDEAQQIETIKRIIHACSKINESLCSEDIPLINSTFTTIAENLSMEHLAIAFAEIWAEDSQAINEQERRIEQAEDDESIDHWNWRKLGNKRSEFVENRERKKRVFNYLAWHIEKHQAMAFFELSLEYNSLPQVAEMIARFACRLDEKTAYDIAVRLHQEFVAAAQNKREYYIGGYSKVEGIGIGLITLASVCAGERNNSIEEIVNSYIQNYSAKEYPYSEQDLRFLYKSISGALSDREAADLVTQGEFLTHFWQEERGDSRKLSLFSQEMVGYLGPETLKVLFDRCIKSDRDGEFWHITESPYILPAIAKKLPAQELSLIYEIGHARGESCGAYGYVRAATENLEHMPEATRLDTIDWALRSWASDTSLKQKVAQFITPDMISNRYARTKITASMAGYLPQKTVQYIVSKFDVSYYGETEGTEQLLQFVRFLPEADRKIFLRDIVAGLFQIKDNGELKSTIKTLEHRSQRSIRRQIKKISRPILTEIKNTRLLVSVQDIEYLVDPLFSSPFFPIRGLGFSDYVVGFLRAPLLLVRSIVKQLRLLRLNKQSHQSIRQRLVIFESLIEDPDLGIEPNSLFQKTQHWMLKQLVSSRIIWILYLLFKLIFTALLLLISSIVAILVLPLFVLLLSGYFLLMLLELVKDRLQDRFGKRGEFVYENRKDKEVKWQSIKGQVQALNYLPDSQARRDAFTQIAYNLGSVVNLIGSREYKEYAVNAEYIWSDLRSEFVADALASLDDRSYSGESHDYVRAILPAVIYRNKTLLPHLIQYIEHPYTQLKAIQYACLSHFLTGSEQLYFLEKSVAAFPYAEAKSFIIPHILTEVAEYATADLIPHLLRWLSDYPVASALEMLAPKMVKNDDWLAQGFAIARKIDDSVHGFVCGIAPSLNKKWLTRAIIFVVQRDLEEEKTECMPALVARWLELPKNEIYVVWQEVLEVMKGYPRSFVLSYFNWLWDVVVCLAGEDHVTKALKEILAVWSWWGVAWEEPARQFHRSPGS